MDRNTVVRGLLVRGLLAGVAAGVLAFAFAYVFAEPQIDKAIAFEEATAGAGGADETALVSRGMQSTLGLLTGTVVVSLALGGLYALGFAAVHGRIGRPQPRTTAAVLALVCFVVIVLVPFTKYPANPPAVGADDTIGYRTGIFFAMLAISIAAALAALRLGRDTVRRFGAWNGALLALGAFVALIAVAQLLMPGLEETPQGFPSPVIWHFRVASLGTHLVIWTTLGLGFGALAQRWLTVSAAAGTYRTSSPSAAAPRP